MNNGFFTSKVVIFGDILHVLAVNHLEALRTVRLSGVTGVELGL